MPAKDIYHDSFVHALQKDGWTLTHDPLTVTVEDTRVMVDVGAERVVAAERGEERIAVEIKSFVSLSAVQDLKEAAGQFWLYDLALKESGSEADRILFLAIRKDVYDSLFVKGIGKLFLRNHGLRLIVFEDENEEILQWIK